MRTCTRCKVDKPLDQFDNQENRLRSHCKTCVSIYTKEHYQLNKEYYLKKAKANRKVGQQRLRLFLREYKRNKGCIDCGESDPIVLEFDHLGDKLDTLASMVSRVLSKERILQEVAKCEVVCSNCHKKRTAHRAGWYNIPL